MIKGLIDTLGISIGVFVGEAVFKPSVFHVRKASVPFLEKSRPERFLRLPSTIISLEAIISSLLEDPDSAPPGTQSPNERSAPRQGEEEQEDTAGGLRRTVEILMSSL